MKKIFLTTSLLLSANTYAHVSNVSNAQHSSEHLLLALLLVPVAWLIVRRLFNR